MILNFSKWRKLNEQQAAVPVDLTPKKFVQSGTVTKGLVNYLVTESGGVTMTGEHAGKYVSCTLDNTGFTVSTKKTADSGMAQEPQVAKFSTVPEAFINFLKNATDLLVVGDFGVTQWGEETAKFVEQLLTTQKGSSRDIRNGLISLCKTKNFVIESQTAMIDKAFKKGIDNIVPSMTVLGQS